MHSPYCRFIGPFLAIFALSSEAWASPPAEEPVTLIGLGAHGESVVRSVPAADYRESLGAVISAVQDSVQPVLDADSVSPPKRQKWALRTVAVGCTITSQIGIGPIWSISPEARLRLIFSNSTSPVYPD